MKKRMERPRQFASHEHALFDIRLSKFLTRWRGRLGYLSMWAALPVLYGLDAQDAQAGNVSDPAETKAIDAERRLRFAQQRPRKYPSSEFLQRLGAYSRSQKTSTLDAVSGGSDDCPGQPIPAGNYTAAAPFTDNGTTVGANNTVNSLYCYYYCSYQMNGPDVIYRLKMSSIGPNAKITVAPTSDNFDAKIYVLDRFYSGGCRSGDWIYDNYWLRSQDGRTVFLGNAELLNQPVYLYVDSPSGTGGSFSLKVEDVTLAPAYWPATVADFDGDFRSDLSQFRLSDGTWRNNLSSQWGVTHVQQWGFATDKMTPADFDGDGVVDKAVYRPTEGKWYVIHSSTGVIDVVQFGLDGDIPQPQDFDGDMKADFGLFRPSNGTWYIALSGSGIMRVQQWGLTGDKPVANDFTGDGKAELAVWRPSNGTWYTYDITNGNVKVQPWGLNGDSPISGDFDGDLKSDFVVYRPSNGRWYSFHTSSPINFEGVRWGEPGDLPAPGDYDADGRLQIAVFRPSTGAWWISDRWGNPYDLYFGSAGDIPTQNAFVY